MPDTMFYDPCLPRLGKAISKSDKTTTMITGSTTADKALPPHFQAAQTPNGMKTKLDMAQHMMVAMMRKSGTAPFE